MPISADSLLDEVSPRSADELLDASEREAAESSQAWQANDASTQDTMRGVSESMADFPNRSERKRMFSGAQADVAAEPAPSVVGASPKTVSKLVASTGGNLMGALAKGLNVVLFPNWGSPETGGDTLSPEQGRQVQESLPLSKLGDWFQGKSQDILASVPERERSSVASQMTETMAGLAPVASGPAAPIVFGLLKTGEVYDTAYQDALEAGKSKDEAAKIAGNKSLLSGAKEAAVWQFGPQAIKKFVGDRILRTAGSSTASRWLAQTGAEGVTVGGTAAAATAAQNVIEGRPAGENVGQEFVSGFVLPRLLGPTGVAPEGRGEIPFAKEVHDVLDRFTVQIPPKPAVAPTYRRPGEGGPTYPTAGESPIAPRPTPPVVLPSAPVLRIPPTVSSPPASDQNGPDESLTPLGPHEQIGGAPAVAPVGTVPETPSDAAEVATEPATTTPLVVEELPPTRANRPTADELLDTVEPKTEPNTEATNERPPRQPGTSPPGVDVREPTATGAGASPEEPTTPASGSQEPASTTDGGPAQTGPGSKRGGGVSGGAGKRTRPGGGPGDVGQPPGSTPVERAGGGVPEAGSVEPKTEEPTAEGGERKSETDVNHVLPTNEDWIPSGDKAKVRANLDAIKLLKQLETEQRPATPDEKATLAKYTGWGGLKEIFDEGKAAYRDRPPWSDEQKKEAANWEKSWGKLYDEVKTTLTPDEHAAARKSILNAHFTARDVINAVWKGAERLGFKGGNALEPAAGVGHFIGLTPESVRAKTRWSAVELDDISGRITQKLYPEARVHQTGFESAKIAPNSQDLVISNVPFAADGPTDPRYPKLSLHNYFFARALDVVKPGGIVAAITSDSTMDNARSKAARDYFAEKADLVGAIRLPNNAFKKNAGTEVTTDILFFRKRDATPFQGSEFRRVIPAETYKGEPIDLNEYYVAHPDMMLGRMSREGSMYGPDQQALIPTPGADLNRQLEEAVAKLPANVMGGGLRAEDGGLRAELADKGSKLGSLTLKNGVPMVVAGDGTLEQPTWGDDAKKVKQAVAYVATRDSALDLIRKQLSTDSTEAELAEGRKVLNQAYDDYFKKYGAINARRSGFLDDDVDFPLALALEDATTRLVNVGGKDKRVTEYSKSKIFSERTLFPRIAPDRVDTVSDGLQVSQNFQGRVDPDYIAKLTGKDSAAVKAELEASGQAFENPESGLWENRPTYLSGFVKNKLKAASAAALDNPRYLRHVEELQKVQPPAIAIENIGVKLGSVFVPESVIEQFLRDKLDVDARVSFTPQTGDWKITPRAGWTNSKNTTTYGIHDWKGHELVEQSLNLSSAIVNDMVPGENGKMKPQKNAAKSLEAQQKQDTLQKEFKDYVRRSPEISAALEQIYNDRYNGVVAPKFDPPTWANYPGASADIQLREHQKAVVTRMLQNSTLLAHAVGTGKTYAMTTAAMEMRRLGLAKKPMIVVQNATLEQFARSFKRLYPTARILSPNAKMRDATNRNKTMSRIATGDWDAVIVPQSFVNMLPDDPVRETGYIRDRLNELEQAKIEAAHEEGKRSPKAADLQRAIDRLQTRLDDLSDRQKDNVLSFEQLGVDALFVDEAHAYKKLEFSTKMDNIKGLDTGASQRGWSMSMKTRWVQEKNQGRNVIFATGTPVSNTIAEAWNMMRYVRPDVLKAYHIEKFDDFASTFGDTITQLEMTPGGTWKPVTRFARYTNGPELISAWRTVADVVTPEEINLPGLPALKNGKPTVHVIPQSPALHKYVEFLRSKLEEFAAMSGKQKRENSHIPLVVFGLAKKASLDMRMIDPSLPDQPGSKLNVAADAIAQIHRDSTSVKGAQMVFSDSFQDNPDEPRFNLYQEMKKKLIERGVPEKDITIITADIKDAKREALFTKVNDGDIRVVLGSTERMGVGVNAQEHLIGLHHLDAPARPMDIEQRNGRILRQGNQNPEVEVHSYGVENTLDAAMFQKLATKQKFINQILRGDLQGRNFEDAANEQSLTFEEQMAAFSGDKRAMEKVGLENQVRQLESLRSGHFEQLRKARETITNLTERTIPYQTKQLAEAARRSEAFGEAFAPEKDYVLNAGDKTINGRKDVAASLDRVFKAGIEATLKDAKLNNSFGDAQVPLGKLHLNGREIELTGLANADAKGIINPESARIGWKFTDGGAGGLSTTGAGFFHSLAATLERISGEPARAAASLAGEQRNLKELTGFVQQPFEREAELAGAKTKLAALTAELEAEGKTPPPSGQAPDEKTQPGSTSSDISGEDETEHGFSGNTTLVQAAAQDVARVRNLIAPQTGGGPARFAGNLLRELNARMSNELARADVALRKFRRDFDRTPVNPRKFKYDPTLPLPRNFEFIKAYENGDVSRLAPVDQLAAVELHKLNAEDLARVQGLGTGALTTFYANYFPHIWDNPKLAASVFGKILGRAPLEGPKGFLKQRTYQLFEQGLAAGLKPVHDNPIDLWLLKKREIERYVLAHNFTTEMKANNLMKFVYAFSKTPDGWSRVDDRAFTVYGPPTVTIKEAFDAGMREATLDLLKNLGVPHERLARIGGRGRWGYEREMTGIPGSERIVTKFAGPDFVIWHELGHVLDNRYADLKPTLTATDTLQTELRALADQRLDPTAPSASAKRYNRSMPEKMAVVLQAYVHAPELMGKIAPTVKVAFENFIKAHPELSPLNDIRPGLRLGVGEAEISHGGLLKLGDYVMPEAAAKVVNNYLSPGLNPHLWYRTLRTTSNLLNGVQLGLSAFHLGFTSLDAATSRLSVAMEDAAAGKIGRALATAATVPVSPFTNIRTGAKLRAEVLRPGTHPEMADLAQALERAGGRVGLDAFWQTEFTRRMIRAWHEGGLQWATLPIRLPLAAWEQTMRPILEYVVPRQKLGVFADMAKRDLVKLGPMATIGDTREALRKSWDSVDNRMGQVVYDNLFYNRAVKDVALLSFRAYGWQLGKYREGAGAILDAARAGGKIVQGEKPEFTHRMAYAMALPIMVGTIGGVLHYLMTGHKPDESQDYFQPKTGDTDANGNPVRLNLPSYVKDALAYGKHPITSLGHSLNPLISSMMDLLGNRDFYNVRIRNPDDPLLRQGGDVADFAAKQFVPFSVSGAQKLREDAAPAWKQVAPFFGITPVPQRLTLTPAQEMAGEIMSASMPAEPRTKEQFDRSALLKDIITQIKRGQPAPEWLSSLAGGMDKGTLAPNTAEIMIQRLEYTPLQFQVSHFTPDTAVRVYLLANDAEREQLKPILAAKIANARTLWPAEKVALVEKMIGAKASPNRN